MPRSLVLAFAIVVVTGIAAPAHAERTGGLRAKCQVLGKPAVLDLSYEAIGSHGITTGPGPDPEITGVIPDGSVTVYWNGTLRSALGEVPISGENHFLRFYDRNVTNRETVLEVTMTGERTFSLTDVYGNYPGQHPCRIVRSW